MSRFIFGIYKKQLVIFILLLPKIKNPSFVCRSRRVLMSPGNTDLIFSTIINNAYLRKNNVLCTKK